MDTKHIKISDYNYDLPDERIAKFPISQRDHSKLLVYKHGEVSDDVFFHLPDYLPKGAMMVFNNTKVIQARMHFRKETGALIEVFLMEPAAPTDYELMFQTSGHCSWLCMIGNLKKWKEGSLKRDFEIKGHQLTLSATMRRGDALSAEASEMVAKGGGTNYWVDFDWDNEHVSFAEILEAVGELPIPPYLNRKTEESDKTTYQTVYSKIKGSVAAPTAGLHFTDAVLQDLDAHGIDREEVTLHVGAGTFKPVKSLEIEGHQMHTEYIVVHRRSLEKLIKHECQVIAVGTTSVRSLESAWSAEAGKILPREREATSLYILPGYHFNVVDALITNFHVPRSTLMMLVSAFSTRDNIMNAYHHAIDERYRMLSFGDAMFLH